MTYGKILSAVTLSTLSVSLLPLAHAEEFRSLLGNVNFERVHQARVEVRDAIKEENQLGEANFAEMTVDEYRDSLNPIIIQGKKKDKDHDDENQDDEDDDNNDHPIADFVPQIMDDGDEGYGETGHWDHFPLSGYEGDFHYVVGSNPIVAFFMKARSSWNFKNLHKGKYDVYVTWDAYETLAKDAHYKINSDEETIANIEVDQSQEPTGLSYNGHIWQLLDTVKIHDGKNIHVELSNQANGFVIADAAMIVGKKSGGGNSADISLSTPEIYPQPAEGAGLVQVSQIVANAGPAQATGVIFKSNIPASLTFVPENSDGSCSAVQNAVVCQGFQLNVPLVLAFSIPNGSSPECQELTTYYAKVAADQPDPIQENNSRTADIRINCGRESHASLQIAVKSTGLSDVTVENAKNVTLLRFEGRAGADEDILFTKAIFGEDSDPRNLANMHNYALWVDTDNDGTVDTILEDGVAYEGAAAVTFGDLAGGGYVIPQEETVVFEVHGDVASSLTSQSIQLVFGTAASDPYVEAEENDTGTPLAGIETDGSCPQTECAIKVYTTTSILWYLHSQGDLYMVQDSTPVRNRQFLGGALGETALRLELRAETEAIDVTDLQISVDGDIRSIDRLELYKEGEVTPFALATVGGCGSDTVPPQTLCANMENQQLVVPRNERTDVLVRPRIKSDTQGGVSGNSFSLHIYSTPIANDSTGEGALRARGYESSNNLLANDEDSTAKGEIFIGTSVPGSNADIMGRKNDVVMAKVVSIANVNPDANGTSVPFGNANVGQFKFTATNHSNSSNGLNDVVVSDVIFTVNGTNVEFDASDFTVFNAANSTVTVTCLPKKEDGTLLTGLFSENTFLVECADLANAPVNTEIDQGNSETLVLGVNITNPAVNGAVTSVVQVSLQNFSQRDLTAFGTASGESHLRWIDKDFGSSQNFLWIEYPETTVRSTSYQS